MSLADNKRNVFTTIGSYTSFMEQQKPVKPTDIFPSINNKKDVVPYLLDVLKVVAGTDGLKELVGNMVTKVVASSEQKIKDVLIKQFTQSNAGDSLPNDFVANGHDISVKSIDATGKFKTAPTSDVGKLLYQKAKDIDKDLFYKAIQSGSASVSFGNMKLVAAYNENSDSFNIKPSGFTGNIGDFFTNYINNTQLIDSNELVTNVMDSMYGTLKHKLKKTQAQILQELELNKLLEQIMNGDDSMVILPQDYEDLQQRALELSMGIVNYDLGCGLMPASLSFDSLSGLNTTISGSTDPFLISNAMLNTIPESTTGNTQTTVENQQTIKDGFLQRLIKLFVEQMTYAGTQQPQIKMLLALMNAFQQNAQPITATMQEYMKQFKIFLKCMVNEIVNMIVEYIFYLAVGYMVQLLTPVIKKLLKEAINQFRDIIKSLFGGSKVAAAVSAASP